MTTVWLDAVFKPFLKIVHDTGQQLTIDRANFLTDGFLQTIQRTGFVSVNTRFQVPPKKKITRWKIGRARGPRHVSETGNEVPGKYVSNNGHWLVCSVRCGTILLKPHIGTAPPPRPTYWVLPIQKMSGSRGSLCRKYIWEKQMRLAQVIVQTWQFKIVSSYSPCCVQDKLISTKSVRTRRLFILCITAAGRQLEWKRPKHAASYRLPAAIYPYRMSNLRCVLTDFLLNIFFGSVHTNVGSSRSTLLADTRFSAPLQQPAMHSSWRTMSWRNL